jgi:hypothetical protein
LAGHCSHRNYPERLRRVRYYDAKTDKCIVLITNNCLLPAITIADMGGNRYQVELFFQVDQEAINLSSRACDSG